MRNSPRFRSADLRQFFLAILLIVIYCAVSPAIMASDAMPRSVQPKLDLKALAEPLENLTAADRALVDRATKLIEQKKHIQALTYLTELTASNPKNSSVRVLRAYVLLELGNVVGALGDARSAEDSGTHAAYKCWFLAQVAYIAGDKPLCRREIKHLSGNANYAPEVDQLRRDLKSSAE